MLMKPLFALLRPRTGRRLWANLPLRLKGLVVISIPLIALVGSTGSWYLIQRQDLEADTWVEKTEEIVRAIQACLPRSQDDAAESRGLARLETLLAGQPVQLRRLRQLEKKCGVSGVEALRSGLRAMRTEQEKLLVARVERVARVRRRALITAAANAVFGFGGGVLAVLLFTSGIARRAERLQWRAALLEQRLPLPACPCDRDELGSLEQAFESASARLRRSEEERDRFFRLSLDMLCIAGLDGTFKRVNPAFTSTLGIAETDLLAGNFLDLVHPEDREAAARQFQELAGGRPVASLEVRFLCSNGSYKWLAWSIAPYLAEGLAYAVAHDRTRQRLDEEALRQSGKRLAWVMESISEGFFAADRDYRLIYVNPEAQRLWTHARRDLTGRLLWDVFPEDEAGPFHTLYRQALRTGKSAHAEEYYAPLDRWFEVHAYPSPEGLSAYFRDITERRRADERVRRALKEKEVLLREIHHRVKNNLQVICSLLRLQERYLDDEMLRQVLRDSRERVHAMAILHDQLHRARDLATVDLGDYVRNLAASLFCSYGVNSAQIELKLGLEAIPASIDIGIPCGLIVHELVSNALQHAFPGGRRGRISIGLHARQNGEIELMVADDGTGYAQSRAGSPDRPSLGLRLVDLLAEQIGAAVERSSGAGTQYRLVFKEKIRTGSESNEQASHHVG